MRILSVKLAIEALQWNTREQQICNDQNVLEFKDQ